MATATYVSGNPVVIDYTPTSAATAGDVVIQGLIPCIVQTDIEADQLGSVRVFGSIERFTTAATFDVGDMAFYNADTDTITATTTDYYIGRVAKQPTATTVDVILNFGTEALGS
jgi:predicted RecA/RadA family phage recombinase